jgi:hypothetical protein
MGLDTLELERVAEGLAAPITPYRYCVRRKMGLRFHGINPDLPELL